MRNAKQPCGAVAGVLRLRPDEQLRRTHMQKIHEIKIAPEYFEPVFTGRKNFEVRKNDRGYRAGDSVIMREWSLEHGYSGRVVCREIGYVSTFEQRPGWCVFGLL